MESNPINNINIYIYMYIYIHIYIELSFLERREVMCFCMYLGDGLFNTVDGSEIPRPDGGTSPGMVVNHLGWW